MKTNFRPLSPGGVIKTQCAKRMTHDYIQGLDLNPDALRGFHFAAMLGLLSPQGVGERIAARDIPKIAILNGNHDRETSRCAAAAGPMGAADVVLALHHSLNRRGTESELNLPGEAYVTAMLAPAGGQIHVDKHRLLNLGVRSGFSLVFCCADVPFANITIAWLLLHPRLTCWLVI